METLKLIDGQFTPEEAREILLEMISSKINFHTLKNLSSEIRFNRPDAESEERIAELQETKNQILAMVREAKATGSKLVIGSSIRISFQSQEQVQELCLVAENY